VVVLVTGNHSLTPARSRLKACVWHTGVPHHGTGGDISRVCKSDRLNDLSRLHNLIIDNDLTIYCIPMIELLILLHQYSINEASYCPLTILLHS